MSGAGRRYFLCSCNGTQPLDAAAIGRALGLASVPPVATMLCQGESATFEREAAGDVVVACTQEARRFEELAAEGARTSTIRFVNLRESGGWSREARAATPKLAALLAAAALPEPTPVAQVDYRSDGRVLIVGPMDAALGWAGTLESRLAVTVLATGRSTGASLPAERGYPVVSGALVSLEGWLGVFEARWTQDNPIDLDACTRCHACVRACPERAIDESYQVDLDRCRAHRACVAACGEVRAIDFARAERARGGTFDLVLDLQREPALRMHQPPQGYFAPGADPVAQAKAVADLAGAVGEFTKPKYFAYKPSICAHGRSRIQGCTACIDVCSTVAIRSDGDRVAVEPHLCMGCGGCATVCPSGAMTYAYPSMADLGGRVRTLLATYARAGGRDAVLLVHAPAAREALARVARRGRGLPANVIPLEVHHVASVGLDLWLSALAWGASGVSVLCTGDEAASYREALAFQMRLGETIAGALGYQGPHFALVDAVEPMAAEAALWTAPPALAVRAAATYAATNDKRATLGFALDHLARHAPVPRETIALPSGAPWGRVDVDADRCTLCLSCVGSCPEGALLDGGEALALRFIESKCVQCGICVSTCPERAMSLVPRLDLTGAAREPRVLNEAQIVGCTACGRPLGPAKMIDGMVARLAGHSMFKGPGALDRLRMCADCRAKAMMTGEPDGIDLNRGGRI
ncbi:MAG: 4Fe-4S binding protein [Burkholderiales bacterium]